MIDRYAFQWRDNTYCLNRGTVSFWPQARLIANPNEAPSLYLVTDENQFLAYALQHGCVVEGEYAEQDPCAACAIDLERRGYAVWTIAQALDYIDTSPKTEAAAHLMACLTQWFFIEKLPT